MCEGSYVASVASQDNMGSTVGSTGEVQQFLVFYLACRHYNLVMKIYLLRHGKTVDREQKLRQGPDSKLGELGRKQAHLVGQRLAQESIDRIITSPWPRAHETAQIVSKYVKAPLEVHDKIHEFVNNSILHHLHQDHELAVEFRELEKIKGRTGDINWKYKDGGESFGDIIARTRDFKGSLLDDHSGQSVLVVSHGGFISFFTSLFLLGDNAPDEYICRTAFMLQSQGNTAISMLEYKEEKGGWLLNYFNDMTHLDKK